MLLAMDSAHVFFPKKWVVACYRMLPLPTEILRDLSSNLIFRRRVKASPHPQAILTVLSVLKIRLFPASSLRRMWRVEDQGHPSLFLCLPDWTIRTLATSFILCSAKPWQGLLILHKGLARQDEAVPVQVDDSCIVLVCFGMITWLFMLVLQAWHSIAQAVFCFDSSGQL